jgi:cytochrome c oxidase assembly protein subunit 15
VSNATFHRGVHLSAWATAAFTLPLIFIGGLVTSKGVGLAVPDWPNSFGYNMWYFPPSQWIEGIFYEHVHRLKGTIVGFCSIVLVLQAWGPAANPFLRKLLGIVGLAMLGMGILLSFSLFTLEGAANRVMQHTLSGFKGIGLICIAAYFARVRHTSRLVRWLSVAVLIAVIFQGLLGGLRVTEISTTLAIVHGCFAHAFFALVVTMIVLSSRWWSSAPALSLQPDDGRRLTTLLILCVATIFLQLIVGAIMRHHQAGLAVPDLPLHYGQLLPPMNSTELAAANAWRATLDPPLGPVELWQVWIHVAHRVGALVVSALVLAAALLLLLRARPAGLRPLGYTLLVLLATQFTLGVLSVYLRKPADIASLHVAVGALLLVVAVALLLRVSRVYAPRHAGRGPLADATPCSTQAVVRGLVAGASPG